MKKLPKIGALSARGVKKGKEDVFRLISLSTLLLIVAILMEPAPVDMLYILLIESLCFIVIMVLSFFFTGSIGFIVLGLLMSIILVPLLLIFLYSALMMIVMMLGMDAMTEGGSAFPLINYSITILDGNVKEGVLQVADYFGDRLYWIIGGILVHHLFFDLWEFYKKNKEKKANVSKKKDAGFDWRMDMFLHFTFKAMIQSTVIMLMSLVIAIPIAIIVLIWPVYTWMAYVLVVVFRIGVEWLEKDMGEAGSVMG